VTRRLTASEIFPAGVAGIEVRFVRLATGITVRVAESGQADGVPLILLHGWGASLYMWRHAFQLLPPLGIRPIAVDLRGFGLSDRPTARGAYTLDAYCADVDALYDTLGVARAAVAGHSMGGALALRYALRRPERVERLALINPVGLERLAYPAIARAIPRAVTAAIGKRIVSRSLIEQVLRRLVYRDPSAPTERDVDEYWAPTQLPHFVHAADESLRTFDWRPLTTAEAGSLAVPTLVLLGDDDRLIRNTRAAASRLAGAEVHELAGGHAVHEERPGDAYALLGAFVR
jgi:pimeloyl-ACP methyl ester carboxylesterase